jgi:hypothetical protein
MLYIYAVTIQIIIIMLCVLCWLKYSYCYVCSVCVIVLFFVQFVCECVLDNCHLDIGALSTTLTEVLPCVFLSCKANARV